MIQEEHTETEDGIEGLGILLISAEHRLQCSLCQRSFQLLSGPYIMFSFQCFLFHLGGFISQALDGLESTDWNTSEFNFGL